MDTHENEDEQLEVEVSLYAEDDLDEDEISDDLVMDDSAEESESLGGVSIDFGEQAESVLDDIKSDSAYGLSAQTDAESFDPDEAPANAVVYAEDVIGVDGEGNELSAGNEVEELPESIVISEEEELPPPVEEESIEASIERSRRSRKRLRTVLVVCLVVLAVLGAVIGVFVWRNSTPPDVKQSDPDAMQASKAGVNATSFQAVNADQVPDLAFYFGMTPEEAATASGGMISLDAEATPATDEAIPALKSLRNGWVVGKNGDVAANISFGLDEDGRIVYTLATFDLDAYGVADAKFDELATSSVVAASMLTGVGLDAATVDAAQVTIVDRPEAVTSRDTAGKEIVEFSGSTNRDQAPREWKLTEIYDHTAGASLGDNSVIRTLSIDLR